MKEQKKPSAFSVLMGYAGGYKILTYLSLILSAACGLMALMPFVYLWKIIQEVVEVYPNIVSVVTAYGVRILKSSLEPLKLAV